MFGRRNRGSSSEAIEHLEGDVAAEDVDVDPEDVDPDAEDVEEDIDPDGGEVDADDVRSQGPWDVSEVDPDDSRIDFGGLQVSAVEGLELQVQADQETGRISLITLVLGPAAAQVQAFAAPKSSGIWPDVRAEIVQGIRGAGGQAHEADGPFGVEVHAKVQPTGGTGLAPARFVGIDGPRWFLRAILLGAAATPGAQAAAIEDALRGIVVVRGAEAMAPREPLALSIPGAPEAAPTATLPNPFERGPEITEIR